VSKLQDI